MFRHSAAKVLVARERLLLKHLLESGSNWGQGFLRAGFGAKIDKLVGKKLIYGKF